MVGKRKASWVAAATGMVLAATCGLALAQGWHGHRGGSGGDGSLFMLAKAAGVDHSQMHTAFKGDTALKTDFGNVKTAHQALMGCLASGGSASGGSCDSQITAFASAQEALTMEKYKVWEGLFKSAPNTSKSTALLSQMQQLQQQRHAMFQAAFGDKAGGTSTDTATTPTE
jgi:hypothetical protein